MTAKILASGVAAVAAIGAAAAGTTPVATASTHQEEILVQVKPVTRTSYAQIIIDDELEGDGDPSDPPGATSFLDFSDNQVSRSRNPQGATFFDDFSDDASSRSRNPQGATFFDDFSDDASSRSRNDYDSNSASLRSDFLDLSDADPLELGLELDDVELQLNFLALDDADSDGHFSGEGSETSQSDISISSDETDIPSIF